MGRMMGQIGPMEPRIVLRMGEVVAEGGFARGRAMRPAAYSASPSQGRSCGLEESE